MGSFLGSCSFTSTTRKQVNHEKHSSTPSELLPVGKTEIKKHLAMLKEVKNNYMDPPLTQDPEWILPPSLVGILTNKQTNKRRWKHNVLDGGNKAV